MLKRILSFVMAFAIVLSVSMIAPFSADTEEDVQVIGAETVTAESTPPEETDAIEVADTVEDESVDVAISEETRDCDSADIAGIGAEEKPIETGANNSLATAKTITLNREYQDYLSKSSEEDYFLFNLTDNSKLCLNVRHDYLNTVSTIWNFDILNANGVRQVRFYVHGNVPAFSSGNIGLPSGKYYLKVSANAYRSIQYAFKLNSSLVSDWETESNDSIANADKITVNKDYHGSLAYNTGDVDYYKIELVSASKNRIVFKHDLVDVSSERWRVCLMDMNGSELLRYYIKGNVATSYTPYIGLPAGTFYIKIYSNSSSYDTNDYDYTFNVNSTASSDWETEPNNAMATADAITVNKNYYGSLSGNSDVDYYKLSLNSKSKISIGFHHSMINTGNVYWKIVLLDTNGNQPLYLSVVGNKEDLESETVELAAGTYYVKVSPSTYSELNYRFVVNTDVQLSVPQVTGFDSVDDGVKITWGKVSGAVKYRVFYHGSKGWTSMGDTAGTSFIDSDVVSGKTYTYSVRCVSADGTRYQSDMNTTGWKYTYNMSTPKITNLYSTDKGVNITWGKVLNASRYRVYYKNKNGNWVKMAEIMGTSYLDTDVNWGGNYTYTIRCVNAKGRFTSDCDTTGWKHQHYLSSPKITKMASSSNGVTLTWDKVNYAVKYRTYYKNRNGNWVKMGETTSTSFLDDDVSYGTTYTYTVRCITSDGKTFTSDCSSTGWKHTYYQDTPQITGFSSVAKGVKISWKSVGAQRYRVYYYGSKGWTRMGEVTGTSFIDEDVRIGKTYRYTVRAVNTSGKFTSDCNADGWKYTYNPVLSKPVIIECDTVADGVKISWEPVPNAYLYRIYYRNKNGNWVKMGDTADTGYTDTVVKGGTTYTYAVRCLAAKNDEFASSYSAAKSHTYVDAPSITKLVSENNGVQITWSVPTGSTRYRVYYKNKKGNWVKMVETTANTYLDTDVTNGGNYTYTVRCVDANGSFTSWFNTTGWKCTYNYTNWSALYKEFILNKQYLNMIGSGTVSYTNNNAEKPNFRLHDFDKDGIPELIGFTGLSQWSRNFVMHTYTVKNGKVVYLNMIIASNLKMGRSTDSRYPGLFCYGGSYDIYRANYICYKNGQIEVKDIATATPKERADWNTGIKLSISDSELYQAYKNCCTNTNTDWYFISFKEKYPVVGYTYEEIKAMGWNNFIAKYGY